MRVVGRWVMPKTAGVKNVVVAPRGSARAPIEKFQGKKKIPAVGGKALSKQKKDRKHEKCSALLIDVYLRLRRRRRGNYQEEVA